MATPINFQIWHAKPTKHKFRQSATRRAEYYDKHPELSYLSRIDSGTFLFLHLPSELRNAVYEQLLASLLSANANIAPQHRPKHIKNPVINFVIPNLRCVETALESWTVDTSLIRESCMGLSQSGKLVRTEFAPMFHEKFHFSFVLRTLPSLSSVLRRESLSEGAFRGSFWDAKRLEGLSIELDLYGTFDFYRQTISEIEQIVPYLSSMTLFWAHLRYVVSKEIIPEDSGPGYVHILQEPLQAIDTAARALPNVQSVKIDIDVLQRRGDVAASIEKRFKHAEEFAYSRTNALDRPLGPREEENHLVPCVRQCLKSEGRYRHAWDTICGAVVEVDLFDTPRHVWLWLCAACTARSNVPLLYDLGDIMCWHLEQ